jgi:hypothetical protein
VQIVCKICGAKRNRKVYGYEHVADWTDNEEVRCYTCGGLDVEIVVEGQGKG